MSKTYRSPSRSVRISGIPRVGALSSLGIRDRYPREGRDHEHESGNHGVLRPTGAVHVLDRDRVRSCGRGADPERGGTQRGRSRRSIRDERGRQRYPRGGQYRVAAVGRGQARSHGGPCARRDRSGRKGPHRCGTRASSKPCRAVCSQRPFGPKGPHRCGTRASSKPWRAVCSPGSSICSFGRFPDPDGDPRSGRPASRAARFACIFSWSAWSIPRRDPVIYPWRRPARSAETPGFEPGKECYPLNRLAGGSFRPLRHVSAKDSRRWRRGSRQEDGWSGAVARRGAGFRARRGAAGPGTAQGAVTS